VGRQHFIHGVAEYEAAIQHRDFRLGGGKELAVEKNRFAHERLPGGSRPAPGPVYESSHRRMVSQMRPKKPASGTSSSATTGYSPICLSSSVTRTMPTSFPAEIGASSGCCEISSAFNRSAWPRGSVR